MPEIDLAKAAVPEHTALRLGRYVSHMQFEDLSEEYVARMGALLLYGLTVALAPHGDDDPIQTAMPAIYDAPGDSTVLLTGARRAPAAAAAINAALMTARSQTDTHKGCGGHIGCVVIPAVLALAQQRRLSARALVAALAAGYEIPPRVGEGAVALTTSRGFRGTPLYGALGAAAGCARVLGLDAGRAGHALSIAANLASGLTQGYEEGTAEAIVQVAEASRSGVIAALLAERGVAAADATFEGNKGFYVAHAGTVPELMLEGWMLPGVVIKATPGCIINQAPVRVLAELMQREKIGAGDVANIVVHLHPAAARYPGIDQYGPFPSKQGTIMSAAFMLRVVLENGSIAMRDMLERFGADDIHERSRMIEAVGDAGIDERYGCRLAVHLHDGRVFNAGSGPVSGVGFDVAELTRLCGRIANEWPTAEPDIAFARLRVAVDLQMRAGQECSLDALFEATSL